DLREIAVLLEQAELRLDHHPHLALDALGLVDLAAQEREELGDPVLEDRDEDVVLVLEVEVDGAVRDARRLRDLADPRGVEALAREDLDRGSQDALALVGATLRLGFPFGGGSPEWPFILRHAAELARTEVGSNGVSARGSRPAGALR